jgi:CTP synthase (UTP-ammonia lyase)
MGFCTPGFWRKRNRRKIAAVQFLGKIKFLFGICLGCKWIIEQARNILGFVLMPIQLK